LESTRVKRCSGYATACNAPSRASWLSKDGFGLNSLAALPNCDTPNSAAELGFNGASVMYASHSISNMWHPPRNHVWGGSP